MEHFLLRIIAPAVCALAILYSCQNDPSLVKTTSPLRMMDDTLLNMNKKIVEKESQEIDDFIARYQWKMKITSTGLRYMIYKEGKGNKALVGSFVKFRYSLKLLTGKTLTENNHMVIKEIQLGRGMTEPGLEEGILLLREGDLAKFIVPSHLAYGLLGNLKDIPERASLVYDVQLLEVRKAP